MRRTSWAVAACLAAALSGCASTPPRSVDALAPPETVAADRLREQMRLETARLLEHQQKLREQITRKSEQPVLEPVAPRFDPLEGKLINVAMSKASISTVLQAFADAGKLNLIVDPHVLKGGQLADMFLRNVTLREGLQEVLRTYDVVGEINANTLRVNLTEEKFFKVSFLNTRSTMQLGSGGNVFGSTGSTGGNSAQQGTLTLSGGGGFASEPYQELETALKNLLGDAIRPQAAAGSGGAGQGQTGVASPAVTVPGAVPSATTGVGGGLGVSPGPLALPANTLSEEGGFSLNKMTGTLYVKARPAKMRAVEKLIEQVQSMLTRQVYVEAQLIDVQLSDNFEFGVDWQHLRSRLAASFGTSPLQLGGSSTTLPNATGGALVGRALTIPSQLIGSLTGPAAGLSYQGSNYGVIINALRSFGNLKILSNPNIQVRNGTPALLSVGNSARYISQSSTTQTAPGGGATTTASNVQTDTVFSGVMVGVLPLIREDGRVEVLINPMQSDVDPASLQLVQVGGGNVVTLPQVSFKGLTTTLNVGDGDVVVVGGLIDQRHSGNDRGAPGVSDVPLLGRLFGNERKTHTSRELVIVLRVHVL
jgi:general secretion pathway protein D